MIIRDASVRTAFGVSIAVSSLLLACSGDTPVATDAGPDGSAQDGSAQDGSAQDGSAQDATTSDASDAATDGKAGDAGSDAADGAVDAGAAALCVSTGGTVGTAQCCKNTTDFPNTCTVGPCGCSPNNSHTVATCQCPGTQCFTAQLGCH